MTEEQKVNIINELVNDSNITYTNTKESTQFGYDKILTEIWENDSYKLIRTNTWVEAYNNQNTLGGYTCESSQDELIEKGGDN